MNELCKEYCENEINQTSKLSLRSIFDRNRSPNKIAYWIKRRILLYYEITISYIIRVSISIGNQPII